MREKYCRVALFTLLAALACDGPADVTAPQTGPAGLRRPFPGGTQAFSAAPPVVLQSFATDWTPYPVGSAPAGWTQRWDPTALFSIATEASVTSGKVLQWSGTGQLRDRWALAYDGFGDVGDQEVYTDFRVRSRGGGSDVYYMGVAAVRIAGTGTDERGYGLFFVEDTVSARRNVVVATWVNGVYWELGSADIRWQTDVWYSVRLRALGRRITARVWPTGATEPSTWQFDIDDPRYSNGRPGVVHHENGVVQWARWTGLVLSDTSTPPTPAGTTYQSTFNEFGTGIQPALWSETSAPNNSAWAVAADATTPDARVLRNVTTVTGRHILRYDPLPDTTTAQEVLVKMRLADDDDRGPGVALRHSMDASGRESAYVAYLRSVGDQVEVNAFVAGGWQYIGQASFVSKPGQWYWMRFRAEGTALRVRVWADGAAEPTAWTFAGSNSALASGSAGLYTYEANTVDYDLFSVATGGLTAINPAPGSPPPPPTIIQVSVTPATAGVQVGNTAQFQAIATMSDGSTTSPSVSWSATGGTISAAGLFTAGSTAGNYQVTATELASGRTGIATVSVTAAPPPPPSGSTWKTSFAEYAVGAQPAGWTETSRPDNSTWTVVADATATGGRLLRNTTTGIARHILRYDAIPDTTTTQEVLVRMRMSDDDDRGPGIALRHTMDSNGNETAYVAYLRSVGDQVELNAFVHGGWQYIGQVGFVNNPGQWYWMRFRAEGTTLRVRVWADGALEPTAWTYTASSSAIAAGGVGAYTYEPNTVDFDVFSIGTSGSTAP